MTHATAEHDPDYAFCLSEGRVLRWAGFLCRQSSRGNNVQAECRSSAAFDELSAGGCFQGVDGVQIGLTTFGAPVDIEVRVGGSLVGVHVKCGLWKRWPGDHFEFGVHADQGIQDGDNPLVLVTLRHPAEDGSRIGRIEGFLMPAALRECVLLGKGERFPSTGVISRTDNLVTTIGDYQPLDQLPSLLLKRLGCLS